MSFFDLESWNFEMSQHYEVITARVCADEDDEGQLASSTVDVGDRYSVLSEVRSQDFLNLFALCNNNSNNKNNNNNSQRRQEGYEDESRQSEEESAQLFEKQKASSHHSLIISDTCEIDIIRNERQRRLEVLKRMKYLTCVAAIGGFLSGYNTGVISGALLPLTRVFHLSPFQEESIVSATILFAFCSSMAGGMVNQCCGRRRTILAAAAIFTCGGIFLFGAQNYPMLVMGEVILGVGIGLESLTNPMYISEVSKPDLRGVLVSAYAWMMCFGQFFAGLVDGVFGPFANGWRFMFGTAVLPGTLMFVGFLGLPESPAWLVSIGQEKKATEILKSFRDTDQAAVEECDNIKESLRSCSHSVNGDEDDDSPPTVWQLFTTPSLRRALVVGCSLMLLQQFCGANVVMYYSATVYRMSGFAEVTSMWLSAFTALAQLVGLALSLSFVEKAGRRPLMLTSLTGVAICLFGLGVSFYLARTLSGKVDHALSDDECMQTPALVWNGVSKYCYDCAAIEGCGFCGGACVKGGAEGPLFGEATCPVDSDWHYSECATPSYIGWMPVMFMVLYLIVFGVGVAGLPWTINAEIYPVKYRSLAVGISTGANWLCNLVISSTFLTISHPSVLTLHGSFWMYSAISFLGVAWLYLVLPETKGLSYKQIEKCFDSDPRRTRHHCSDSDNENQKLLYENSDDGYGSIFRANEDDHLYQQ